MFGFLGFSSLLERNIVLFVLGAGVLPITLLAVFAMGEIESQTLKLAEKQLRETTKTYALDVVDQIIHAEYELRALHLNGSIGIKQHDRTTLIRDSDRLQIQLPIDETVLKGTIGFDKLFEDLGHVPAGMSRCVVFDGVAAYCEGTEMLDDFISSSWTLPLKGLYKTDFELSVISSQLRQSALQHVSQVSGMFPLAMFAFAAAIAWMLILRIRRLVAPLTALWKATQSVRKGDYNTRLQISTGDEFERLGHGFNLMTERLADSFEELRALSNIDRLILSGSSVEDVIRHTLLLADENCQKTANIYLWKDEPRFGQLYELVEGSLTTRTLNFALPVNQSDEEALNAALAHAVGDHVAESFQILKEGEASGALFALGEPVLNRIEQTTFSELADRISVAATNLDRASALYRQANYDVLTGLINREAFGDRLSERIHATQRSDSQGALLFLDLDRFKQVNDREGHSVGDKLLRAVSKRLVDTVRSSDTVARLGGDEFAVIVPEYTSQSELIMLCKRIIGAVEKPIEIARILHKVEVSVGVSIFPEDGLDSDSLLMKADVAMYKAKEKKGSTFAFFDQSLNESNERRAHIESRLRKAISSQQLLVYFQPKLHLPSGQIHNAEALLRWPDNNGKFLSPDDFVPVAEETGLVHAFTDILIEETVACIEHVRGRGLRLDRVAINISTQQFARENFANEFLNTIANTSIEPNDIEIEITESLFIEDAEHITLQLRKLQTVGVHIALDDFGTGFSSLNMLRTLPLNTVKIDRSFITPILNSPQAQDLAEKIIEIAGALRLEVVAEGVEQDEELDLLRKFGCDYVQGYLLTPALPANQFSDFVEQHRASSYANEDVAGIRPE